MFSINSPSSLKGLLCSFAATFDVQNPKAVAIDDEKLRVTGTLIIDSCAIGCFLAIQCNETTKITFVALRRNGASLNMSEDIPIPASNYTVHAHDLEEGAIVNPHPANLDPENVTMVRVTGTPCEYSHISLSHCIF